MCLCVRELIASQQLSPFSVRCLSVSLPSLQLQPFKAPTPFPFLFVCFKRAHVKSRQFLLAREKRNKRLKSFDNCSQYNYISLLNHSLKEKKAVCVYSQSFDCMILCQMYQTDLILLVSNGFFLSSSSLVQSSVSVTLCPIGRKDSHTGEVICTLSDGNWNRFLLRQSLWSQVARSQLPDYYPIVFLLLSDSLSINTSSAAWWKQCVSPIGSYDV